MKGNRRKSGTASLQALVTFGLTLHEADTYVTLLQNGASGAKELAKSIHVLPNALYRLLQNLERKGLIVSSGKHPNVFKALPPSIALEALAKKQIADVELNKEVVLTSLHQGTKTDQTKIEVLNDKNAFFRAYVDLGKKAQKTVDIISIGEEIPEEIVITNRDCLERGVTIRFIVHKYDKENKDLLIRWVKMGLLVRHYSDWGYHLVVADNKNCILSANNPKNTDDRFAMRIYSEALSKSLGDYFNIIWERATPIA